MSETRFPRKKFEYKIVDVKKNYLVLNQDKLMDLKKGIAQEGTCAGGKVTVQNFTVNREQYL